MFPFHRQAWRFDSRAVVGFLFLILIVSCTPQPLTTPTPTPDPTATQLPSAVPSSTSTLLPTSTPEPTATFAMPTDTPTLFPTNALPDPSGMWSNEAPMLYARAAHAVVSTGSAIYALAGTDENGNPVLEVERFDGTAWVVDTTLPNGGLNAPAAVYLDGLIYVIGGFSTTTNIPTAEVWVYDPGTQTWREAAPLPGERGGHAAVVLDGKIHIVGGGNSQSTLADHTMYDPATDTWTNLAPLPRSKGSPAAVVLSDTLYVIGGRSGRSDFGEVHLYDPATDTWREGPAIDPRGTAGAVEYCGTIYLIGGESQAQDATLQEVLRLNLENQVWEKALDMPTARNYARAVLFNDSIYIVGGSPDPVRSHASPGLNVVERYHSDCTE